MKIVLLTGSSGDNQNCTALVMKNNKIWLDHQIEKILPLNIEIDIVLGMEHSEDILRNSIYLRQLNIIFDPNEEEYGEFSNVRAGLFASNRESLIFPINYTCPSLKVWQKLVGKLYQNSVGEYDVIRPYCPFEGKMTPGFPVGVTARGRENILNNPELKSMAHSSLKEYRLPVLDQRIFDIFTAEGHKLPDVV